MPPSAVELGALHCQRALAVAEPRLDLADHRHASQGHVGVGHRVDDAALDRASAGQLGGHRRRAGPLQPAAQVGRGRVEGQLELAGGGVDVAAQLADPGLAQAQLDAVGADGAVLGAGGAAGHARAAQAQVELVEALDGAVARRVQAARQLRAGHAARPLGQKRPDVERPRDLHVQIEVRGSVLEGGAEPDLAAGPDRDRVLEVAGVGGHVERGGGAIEVEVERRAAAAGGQREVDALEPDRHLGTEHRAGHVHARAQIVAAGDAAGQALGQFTGPGQRERHVVLAAEHVLPALRELADQVDVRALDGAGQHLVAQAAWHRVVRPFLWQLGQALDSHVLEIDRDRAGPEGTARRVRDEREVQARGERVAAVGAQEALAVRVLDVGREVAVDEVERPARHLVVLEVEHRRRAGRDAGAEGRPALGIERGDQADGGAVVLVHRVGLASLP